MKRESRFLAINDAPFNRKLLASMRKSGITDPYYCLIAGVVTRGVGTLEEVNHARVTVDGDDATEKVIQLINETKFKHQLKTTYLDGLSVGGFNLIDVKRVYQETGVPVVIIMRKYPNKLKEALLKCGFSRKVEWVNQAGPIYAYRNIYFQVLGMSPEKTRGILSWSCTQASIPEPLRLAKIISHCLKNISSPPSQVCSSDNN